MRTFHSPYYATALVTLLLRPEEGLSRYLSLALLFTSLTVLTKTKGLALALVVFLATAWRRGFCMNGRFALCGVTPSHTCPADWLPQDSLS